MNNTNRIILIGFLIAYMFVVAIYAKAFYNSSISATVVNNKDNCITTCEQECKYKYDNIKRDPTY